jgi:hypothetical protein
MPKTIIFLPLNAASRPTARYLLRSALLLVMCVTISACEPTPPPRLTAQPFPTMTIGQTLRGNLTPVAVRPPDSELLSNPATLEALRNQPTATPNYAACPVPLDAVALPELPSTDDAAKAELLLYFNRGGKAANLELLLKTNWNVIGETGYVRQHDLTNSGVPEVVIGYTSPQNLGTLLILCCRDGQYVERYTITATSPDAPQILWVGDMNRDFYADLFWARRICATEDACEYEMQVIEYDRLRGRYIALLDEAIFSLNLPAVNDMDSDEVLEIVLTLESRGNSATGPLRTGVHVYDWNGINYTLSIIQLDPPRYQIQVVHEADRLFFRLDMSNAANLYQLALENTDLRAWFNDEAPALTSYILYRQMLAFAYLGDDRIADVAVRLNTDYPLQDGQALDSLPPYVEMAYTFLSEFQAVGDLHAACNAVQQVVARRPSALNLLNRYGSRSPTYNPLMLCPY